MPLFTRCRERLFSGPRLLALQVAGNLEDIERGLGSFRGYGIFMFLG
jgi:hypothetical protein